MREKETVILKHDGKEYKYILPDDLAVSEQTLNQDFSNHMDKVAWHCVLTARLEAAVDNAEQRLKEVRAEADDQIREQLKGRKDVTETMVKNMVERFPTVQQATRAVLAASEQAKVAKAIKEGFEHRMSSLVSLGALVRAQMGPDRLRESR